MDEAEVRDRMEAAMRRVEDFYFDTEGGGEKMFNAFAEKYAHHFEAGASAMATENKLEYTTAYQEFVQLFESKLEEIIGREGLRIDQFFEQLRKDAKDDEDAAVFIHVVLALSDYTTFVDMMSAYCNTQST